MTRHDRLGEPSLRNGYYYFSKRGAEQKLWSFCRRKVTRGTDEVLLDPLSLSADVSVSISEFRVSDDGKLVAYGTRQGGQEKPTCASLTLQAIAICLIAFPRPSTEDFLLRKTARAFTIPFNVATRGKLASITRWAPILLCWLESFGSITFVLGFSSAASGFSRV